MGFKLILSRLLSKLFYIEGLMLYPFWQYPHFRFNVSCRYQRFRLNIVQHQEYKRNISSWFSSAVFLIVLFLSPLIWFTFLVTIQLDMYTAQYVFIIESYYAPRYNQQDVCHISTDLLFSNIHVCWKYTTAQLYQQRKHFKTKSVINFTLERIVHFKNICTCLPFQNE